MSNEGWQMSNEGWQMSNEGWQMSPKFSSRSMDWMLCNPAIPFHLLVQKIWILFEEKVTLTQSTVNEEEQKKEEKIVVHFKP